MPLSYEDTSVPTDEPFHVDVSSLKSLGRMKTYRHEKTQTQYATFKDTGGLVVYDDARQRMYRVVLEDR